MNLTRAMAKMGQAGTFFSFGLDEVAKTVDNMFVVTADLCGYSGMRRFCSNHPEKVVNVGIAEQGMVGVAAGLALEGNLVYCGSYAAFATARAMEQVKHNMSALNLSIVLVGYSSGYSKESLGVSHWATEDIAMTRCLPGLTVVEPADAYEAYKLCIEASKLNGPVYIRLCDNDSSIIVYEEDYEFKIGKGIIIRKGADAVVFCHGQMVFEMIKAAELLSANGIDVEIVNMHTIKPLDVDLVIDEVRRHKFAFTVEEHNIIGGLGSAIAEVIAENSLTTIYKRIGADDCLYKLGSREYIWEQAGITRGALALNIEKIIKG